MVFDRSKAIEMFNAGLIQDAYIKPFHSAELAGWVLEFEQCHGKRERMTVARKPSLKLYKSADAAISDARAVGLQQVHVVMV